MIKSYLIITANDYKGGEAHVSKCSTSAEVARNIYGTIESLLWNKEPETEKEVRDIFKNGIPEKTYAGSDDIAFCGQIMSISITGETSSVSVNSFKDEVLELALDWYRRINPPKPYLSVSASGDKGGEALVEHCTKEEVSEELFDAFRWNECIDKRPESEIRDFFKYGIPIANHASDNDSEGVHLFVYEIDGASIIPVDLDNFKDELVEKLIEDVKNDMNK